MFEQTMNRVAGFKLATKKGEKLEFTSQAEMDAIKSSPDYKPSGNIDMINPITEVGIFPVTTTGKNAQRASESGNHYFTFQIRDEKGRVWHVLNTLGNSAPEGVKGNYRTFEAKDAAGKTVIRGEFILA